MTSAADPLNRARLPPHLSVFSDAELAEVLEALDDEDAARAARGGPSLEYLQRIRQIVRPVLIRTASQRAAS